MSKLVTNDLQRFFATWILIVATVLLVLQIGVTLVKVIFSVETGDVFTTAFDAYSVVMIVFGVMAVYPYLTLLAFHGVTRKNYLKGTIAAAIKTTFLSLLIALVFLGLAYVAKNVFQLPINGTLELGGFGENLLLASVGYYLSSLAIFFIGWTIGLSFYRLGWFGGTIAIIISLFLFGILDYFWENEFLVITINGIDFNNFWESHFFISLTGTLIILVGLFITIRSLTRNIALEL